MNSRSVNLALWGLNLGLLGVVGFLVYLLKQYPAPAQVRYVTRAEPITNQVSQIRVRKINATDFLAGLTNL